MAAYYLIAEDMDIADITSVFLFKRARSFDNFYHQSTFGPVIGMLRNALRCCQAFLPLLCNHLMLRDAVDVATVTRIPQSRLIFVGFKEDASTAADDSSR